MIPVIAGLALLALALTSKDGPPPSPPAAVPARKKLKPSWRTGRMTLVIGASQSGKTHYTLSQIKTVERLLIWDVEEQYADEEGITPVRSLAALGAILSKNPRRFRLAFVPSDLDEFQGFCQWAWFALECACRTHHDKDGNPLPTYIVAEEISDVTNPGKAPPAWGKLIRRGLKRNMHLYAVTQSPSESDKTTVKNCSEAHICGVQSEEEAEYLGRKLKINPRQISILNREQKQFIHVRLVSGEMSVGGIVPPEILGKPIGNPGESPITDPITPAYKPKAPRRYNRKGQPDATATGTTSNPLE